MIKIIAEAGVNHNGSVDMAQLVDAAAAAGRTLSVSTCSRTSRAKGAPKASIRSIPPGVRKPVRDAAPP